MKKLLPVCAGQQEGRTAPPDLPEVTQSQGTWLSHRLGQPGRKRWRKRVVPWLGLCACLKTRGSAFGPHRPVPGRGWRGPRWSLGVEVTGQNFLESPSAPPACQHDKQR